MFLVVSYDIPNDKRRNRVFKLLKNYGQWMQFSVFECSLTKEQLLTMQSRLIALINSKEDSIRVYIMCEHCRERIVRIGGEKPLNDRFFVV